MMYENSSSRALRACLGVLFNIGAHFNFMRFPVQNMSLRRNTKALLSRVQFIGREKETSINYERNKLTNIEAIKCN